jgi:predicted HNH restriction endonuclease
VAGKLGAEVKCKAEIPVAVERAVRAAAGNKCEVCRLGERYGPRFPRQLLECHHIQPIELAGATTVENLMLVCPTDHTLVQYLADTKTFTRAAQIAYAWRVRRNKR